MVSRTLLAASIAGLLLASCKEQRYSSDDAFDLADAADANARTSLGQNEEQDAKIRELESEIASLESVIQAQSRVTNALTDDLQAFKDAYDNHRHY